MQWPDGYYENQPVDKLEPISITPTILEKNGFKKYTQNCSDYYEYVCIDTGDSIVFKRYPCGYFELNITDNENYRNIRTPINYVHELQHILRYCNINKEIEL